jgi:hypothetical protein
MSASNGTSSTLGRGRREGSGHHDRRGRVPDGDGDSGLSDDGRRWVLCARHGPSLSLLCVRTFRGSQCGEVELGPRDARIRVALPRERRGESFLHRHSNQATDLLPYCFGPPFVCAGGRDL